MADDGDLTDEQRRQAEDDARRRQMREADEASNRASMAIQDPGEHLLDVGIMGTAFNKPKAKRGCGPGVVLAVVVVVIAGIIAALASNDGDNKATDTSAETSSTAETTSTTAAGGGDENPSTGVEANEGTVAAPPGQTVKLSGSSGGPIGCVPCDGAYRFISVDPDAAGGFSKGQRSTSDPGYMERVLVVPADGTLQNLQVTLSNPDRGRWNLLVDVNGGGTLGCLFAENQTRCSQTDRSFKVKEGDRIVVVVGNNADAPAYYPGGPGSRVSLDLKTDGNFSVSITMDLVRD